MADQSLLWDEFFRNCKSHDLPDDLIKEVYDYLMRNQYLLAGRAKGEAGRTQTHPRASLGGKLSATPLSRPLDIGPFRGRHVFDFSTDDEQSSGLLFLQKTDEVKLRSTTP